MPIVMRLDRVMADRKISSQELAEIIGISPVNLSRIKTGRLKGDPLFYTSSNVRGAFIASPATSSIGWMMTSTPQHLVSRTEQCVKIPAQL